MEPNLHSNSSDSVPDYNSFSDGTIMLNPAFPIESFVYAKTDPDQNRLIVTGIVVRSGRLAYKVSFFDREAEYESFELTSEKDYKIN